MATAALSVSQPRATLEGVLDFIARYLGGGYLLDDLDAEESAWAFFAMTAAQPL